LAIAVNSISLYDYGYNPQGALDEVGKWNRALTGPEMDALFDGGAGRAYPFD
jgi:hypothetical protein